MGFNTGGGQIQQSSDVDHQQTTNRTHSGDSISPASVSTGQLQGGVTNSLTVDRIMGERIVNKSPSNVSQVDITSGLNSDYDRYMLDIVDLVPDTDGVDCDLFVSSDGGSTFANSSGDYWVAANGIDSSGAALDYASETLDRFYITPFNGSVGSGSGESLSATFSFSNPANANAEQLIRFEVEYHRDDDALSYGDGAAMYTTAEAINALRVKFDSGNIESGTINLYGVMN